MHIDSYMPTISSKLSASIMSAVTKVYLDNNHFRYAIATDGNDIFTDTYRVLLPLTSSAITEVRITTGITNRVTISVPEFELEFISPEHMRASEFAGILHETLNLIRVRCTGCNTTVS